MSIRSKLAWTFILLLIFGITAISSYSILFIRDYLLEEGVREMEQDTRWLSVTIQNLPQDDQFEQNFGNIAETSGYQIALYDSSGQLQHARPEEATGEMRPQLNDDRMAELKNRMDAPVIDDESNSDKLTGYYFLGENSNTARFLVISQYKEEIYEPITTIRWIIYTGMFISIGLVLFVSVWFARYISKPIYQLKDAARDIADGNVDRQINLDRKDEFGTLATSLNQMASRLRADTEQIKEFAEKQRQFFADITHEIRNPLHTITGSLEMLEMDGLSEEKRKKYLINARKQTERIDRLFKDLVALQRYDSDESFIEKKEFELAPIAHHMLEWYSDAAAEKGVELKVDTHTCRAVGDPGKIEQVIDNLISNAVKYTSEGAIKLSYASRGDLVEVKVEDTGIGISDEHLGRLFDRFYRTDKARSRDKGGTGLGLAVVKSILNAHGTDIEVDSQVGKGSIFSFSLPAVTQGRG